MVVLPTLKRPILLFVIEVKMSNKLFEDGLYEMDNNDIIFVSEFSAMIELQLIL